MRFKKFLAALMMTMMSIVLLAACSAIPMSESPVKTKSNEGTIELTLDELKTYDGQDGNKAYIAIDGKIYDVTDLPPWSGGIHADKYKAGEEYTEEIKSSSPHGLSPLEDLEPIGTLVD